MYELHYACIELRESDLGEHLASFMLTWQADTMLIMQPQPMWNPQA